MIELIVRANERAGQGLHALVLEVPAELSAGFTIPGQYVQLARGEGKPAFMAIASAPGGSTFEFLIQSTDGMAGQICASAPGDTVRCSEVMGKGFAMGELDDRDVVFMAGGTGISAIRSVIESRSDWRGALYYGARSPDVMAYQELFEDWGRRGVKVVATLDEAHEGFLQGYPQQAYAADPLGDGSNAALVLCGPGPMCEAATAMLVDAGMPAARALKNY